MVFDYNTKNSVFDFILYNIKYYIYKIIVKILLRLFENPNVTALHRYVVSCHNVLAFFCLKNLKNVDI